MTVPDCCPLCKCPVTMLERLAQGALKASGLWMTDDRAELISKASLPLGVGCVFCLRAEEQMIRPDAGWRVAVMTYAHAGRYHAVRQFVREAMGQMVSVRILSCEHSVPFVVPPGRPNPALASFIYLPPEPISDLHPLSSASVAEQKPLRLASCVASLLAGSRGWFSGLAAATFTETDLVAQASILSRAGTS